MKLNIYGGPENKLEEIMADVENAKTTKNTYLRETLLDKVLNELMNYQVQEYTPNPEANLVKEEIDKEEKEYKYQLKKELKLRVLISIEVAELAFKESLIEIAELAAQQCLKQEFNVQKDINLVIA